MFQDVFAEAIYDKDALQEAMKVLLENGMQKKELEQILGDHMANMEVVQMNFNELECIDIRESGKKDFAFGQLLNVWAVVLNDNPDDLGFTLSQKARAICHGVLTAHLGIERLPWWIEGALSAVCDAYEVDFDDDMEEMAVNAIVVEITATVLNESKSTTKDARPVRDERDLRQLVGQLAWEYVEEVTGKKPTEQEN
jgi:hypothetical protein